MNELGTEAQAFITVVGNVLTEWGLSVLGAFVLLFMGKIVAGWVRKLVRKVLEKLKVDSTLVPFLASVTYYMVLAMVLIAVLGIVGVRTASLVALVGAAGLAVGLAMQGTLTNISAGVMLMLFRPFKVGDYIDVGGTSGTVEAVGLFYTTLNTPDNVNVTVPNSGIYGGVIKNFSAHDRRRNDIVLGIAYDDDIGLAMQTIRDVLAADDRVLKDPEPTIAVGELGDSSVNILVRPWCKRENYWALRWDLLRMLKERIEAAGCSIPFPQRDIHVYEVSKAD